MVDYCKDVVNYLNCAEIFKFIKLSMYIIMFSTNLLEANYNLITISNKDDLRCTVYSKSRL